MKDSSLIVRLVCLLVALIGLHAYLRYRGDGVTPMIRRSTLVSNGAAKVDSLKISRPGERDVVLVRNDGWRIASPFEGVADEASVLRAVDALCYRPILDARDGSELVRLGVGRDDFGFGTASVRVAVGFGTKSEIVCFGGITPSCDGVFASVKDTDSLFVVSTDVVAAVNRPVDAFRLRKLLTVVPDDVVSLDIREGDESHVMLVNKDGIWSMSEPQQVHAAVARVSAVMKSFSEADAVSFVWPRGATNETHVATAALLAGYGLDAESALSVAFGTADGGISRIALGRSAGDGLVYALIHDGCVIASVPVELREMLSGAATEFADTRLFPVDPAQVRNLSIADGSVRCLVSRRDDGFWRLDAPLSADADSRVVSFVLTRLTSLVASDVVTNGLAVCLGADTPPVVVPRRSVLGDYEIDDLRSCDIIRTDPLAVRRITVFVDGVAKPSSVVFDAERRSWSVESSADATATAVADGVAIAGILELLNPLRAEKVVSLAATPDEFRDCGLDRPRRIVAIDLVGEHSVRRNILIGNDVPDGGAYLTVGSSDAVFRVGAETIATLSTPIIVPADLVRE